MSLTASRTLIGTLLDTGVLSGYRTGAMARMNHTHTEFAMSGRFKQKHRTIPHQTDREKGFLNEPKTKLPSNFRFVYPDFLPPTNMEMRNKLLEKLQRNDMIARRKHIDIPEFYVGSIMAVTVNDRNAEELASRFVGICIQRGGSSLYSWFTLRNVVDNMGVEIKYEMYCPLVSSIETLRLEKRLDDDLQYLRDALPEYSTFPQDMEPELMAEGINVPINEVQVKMIDGPWHFMWERYHMKGIDFSELSEERIHAARKYKTPDYLQYDLMRDYRATIPLEDQEAIFRDMAPHYPQLRAAQRKFRRRKLAGEA